MPHIPQPIVSVIIPFLNGGDWLSEAVESVISQSYLHWEAILIDDGSEEKTSFIAKGYRDKYPDRIQYTDHPGHKNMGVTVSRNVGIKLSNGPLIAFLDADDRWMPGKLLHQVQLFKRHPGAAMICEPSLFWYSWNDAGKKDVVVNIGTTPNKLYQPPQLMKNLYPLGEGAPPCPTGIILKKDAFQRSGGFEESFTGTYQLYEDQAFLAKIYLREKVYVSGKANNFYRKRAGSLTGTGDDDGHYKKVRAFFLDWLDKYLKDHSYSDDEITRLITAARNETEDKDINLV